MFCSKCNHQLNENATICDKCGEKQREHHFCLGCGISMPHGATACEFCGAGQKKEEKQEEQTKQSMQETQEEQTKQEEKQEIEQQEEAQEARLCSNCGNQLKEGKSFCADCGQRQGTGLCSNCGSKLKEGKTFCADCGQRQGVEQEIKQEQAKDPYEQYKQLQRVRMRLQARNKLIKTAVIIVVIAVVGLGAVYAYPHVMDVINDITADNGEEPPPDNNTPPVDNNTPSTDDTTTTTTTTRVTTTTPIRTPLGVIQAFLREKGTLSDRGEYSYNVFAEGNTFRSITNRGENGVAITVGLPVSDGVLMFVMDIYEERETVELAISAGGNLAITNINKKTYAISILSNSGVPTEFVYREDNISFILLAFDLIMEEVRLPYTYIDLGFARID
jgi:predicted amidophosphoribosyltransferase